MCGDFNIHLEDKNNKAVKKFQQMINTNNCSVIATNPTRGDALIDFFIVSDSQNIRKSGLLDFGLSDHKMSFVSYKYVKTPLLPKTRITKRMYRHLNYEQLGNLVINTDFTSKATGVDAKFSEFINNHLSIFKLCAPKKELEFRPRKEKTNFTQKTIDQIKTKRTFLKKWKKRKDEEDYKTYKNQVLKCKVMIKNDAASYFNNLINTRGVWNTLKQLIPVPSANNNSDFTASQLNNYFASVTSSNITVNLVKPNYFPEVKSQFFINLIGCKNLVDAWKSLKKKS